MADGLLGNRATRRTAHQAVLHILSKRAAQPICCTSITCVILQRNRIFPAEPPPPVARTQAGAGFGCQQTGSGAGSAPSWLAPYHAPRRAGHPADGDGSQKLGRQSYGQRCPHASNIGSVLRTCWQQGKHAFAELVHLQRSARPILLEIIAPTPSP